MRFMEGKQLPLGLKMTAELEFYENPCMYNYYAINIGFMSR